MYHTSTFLGLGAFAAFVGAQAPISISSRVPSLAAPSNSVPFVVTTATTAWAAPTFTTSIAPCTNGMCPQLDGALCIDSLGHRYGVLCDQRFSGVIITTSGKKEKKDVMVGKHLEEREAEKELEKRVFTGTMDGCGVWCDAYDVANCKGVDFGSKDGICLAYATLGGTVAAPGKIALVRQT